MCWHEIQYCKLITLPHYSTSNNCNSNGIEEEEYLLFEFLIDM